MCPARIHRPLQHPSVAPSVHRVRRSLQRHRSKGRRGTALHAEPDQTRRELNEVSEMLATRSPVTPKGDGGMSFVYLRRDSQ